MSIKIDINNLKGINLFNADCMEIMKQLPDNWADLAICDPPFGIDAGNMTMGSGKHKYKQGKQWDSGIPPKEYFDELKRVSKNQIIWGGNYFTDYLPPTKHWIVWDKCNPNLSFAEGELAWQSIGTGLRIYKIYSAMQIKIHPTQKPTDLYKWLLKNYAKPTDKIFDSHGGSMSSVIACIDNGNPMVCCELDKEYFDMAVGRVQSHVSQLDLYRDRPEIKIF